MVTFRRGFIGVTADARAPDFSLSASGNWTRQTVTDISLSTTIWLTVSKLLPHFGRRIFLACNCLLKEQGEETYLLNPLSLRNRKPRKSMELSTKVMVDHRRFCLPLKFQTAGLKALLCERCCYLLVRLTLFPSHLNLCFITKLVTIMKEDLTTPADGN